MNPIIKDGIDQLRKLEWPDPQETMLGGALGVFVNPGYSYQAHELNERLQLLCKTLIAAIGAQEIENEIVRNRLSAISDFSQVTAHSIEGRLDEICSSLNATCPGCNHEVKLVKMKANCTNCGTQGHLVWNWKAQDGAIVHTPGNHYHNLEGV